MSQTDMDVANGSGSTVRTDINAHIGALVTNSSGAAAPTPTFPNQWWVDTSTDILKQRDNANTAWVNVASKVGTGWVPYRDGVLLGTASTQGDASETARGVAEIATQVETDAGADDARFVTPLKLANLSLRRKNVLINGNFDIWQRGTSFTVSGEVMPDRWRYTFAASGAGTGTRQAFALGQTDVPGEPEFFFRVDQTSGSSGEKPRFIHRIEDVRTHAGQTVTLSWYMRVASGTEDYTPNLGQFFGSGGAPSGTVNHAGAVKTVTTSWQRFTQTFTLTSITGKTLGTNDDDRLALDISGQEASTFIVDLAQVQIEPGNNASDFEDSAVDEVLARCRRYFFKTFAQEVAPAQNAGALGAISYRASLTGVAIQGPGYFPFPVIMRTSPTIVAFNPNAVNALWRNVGPAADSGAFAAQNPAEQGFSAECTQIAADNAGDLLAIHITAEAEL